MGAPPGLHSEGLAGPCKSILWLAAALLSSTRRVGTGLNMALEVVGQPHFSAQLSHSRPDFCHFKQQCTEEAAIHHCILPESQAGVSSVDFICM